jgi:ribosomal-protein-alanine N-acetyltransferase
VDEHYPIHHGLLNVSLGAMRREYIPLFMPGANDPEVMRGVVLRPPVTLEEEYAWYDGPKGATLIFAILLHEYDDDKKLRGYRYIGHTGLHGIEWPAGHATTGTIIWDRSCLGKGYGTEAKLLMLYEAFRNRGLRKVCSHVKAFNGNSWGHLLACGYHEVGRRKEHHFSSGKFVDDILFEVFRDQWEPIWEKYQQTKELPRLTEEQRSQLKKETGS